MSTPKVFTDGSSGYNEATLNKFVAAGNADKVQCKAWWARIRYTGAAWEVVAATDSAGLASGALAWNGTTKELDVTLTGYTNPPVVLATPAADDNANYLVKAHAVSATEVNVRFYHSDTGAQITTEAATMDLNLLVIGA